MGLSFSFMLALLHHDWPFNVRELESSIKRGLALTQGAPLDAKHLPDAIAEVMKTYGVKEGAGAPPPEVPERETALPAPPPAAQKPAPDEDELRALLAKHQGNVAAVGRELGKERMQIHRWLKRYGIDLDAYRG